ncbi:MAG TPA: hypothetical protein VFP36_06850 [Usitatibacter sp.]|nr:hypothetical protein [Usitatibacter sp.]
MPDVKLDHAYGGRKVLLRGTSPAADGALLARSGSGKPLNNLELVEQLCAVSGTLAEARRTHVHNLGSLVPHVFMGDVLARVGDCLTADTAAQRCDRRPEVEAILGVLDGAAGVADRETRHVIAASFVRDGERAGFFRELRPCLGRKLLALLRAK